MRALEASCASIIGDDSVDKHAALNETMEQAHEFVQKAFASTKATARFVAKAITPTTEIRKLEDDPKPYTKPKGYRKPKSVSSRDAGDRLVERAAALRTALKNSISQDDAVARVLDKNPELRKMYREELRKGLTAGDENDWVPGQDYMPGPDMGEWSNPGPNRGYRNDETLNADSARVVDGSSDAGSPTFRGQPMSVIGAGSGGDDDDALQALWEKWCVKLPGLTPDDVKNIVSFRPPSNSLNTATNGSLGLVNKATNAVTRLHSLAAATQRQHPNMSAMDCLQLVGQRNPDLLRAAASVAKQRRA
jgi:hypothetical protein